MKIVVIGGTGLIGSKTVAILRQGGHGVVAASPTVDVNTVTGEGLKEAITGAQVVIDLSNAHSRDAKSVLEFFETSGRNLLAAETAAGVQHHVALSIVGSDRVPGQSYYRARVAQEKLIEASSIPYTIIRSTQFLDSSAASPMRVRMEALSGFRRAYFSLSRPTTWLPLSPRWPSLIHETGLSRLQARSERRSTRSSLAI
jgi:uncharacterized protein YbjT (DUF2867 family)